MPALTGDYVLADNTYTNGICYFHVQVNGNVTAPQAPYNIYRNQYFKITVNSIQPRENHPIILIIINLSSLTHGSVQI